MTKNVEVRHDSTGMKIQLHDVLKNEETGEMALVVFGSNKSGVRGLAIENKIIGSGDWLDVFPDGLWTIVGNAEECNLNEQADRDIELKEPNLNLLVEAWDEYLTNEVKNPVVAREDFLTAMEKATEIFGQDPAYYGKEGEDEVFKQLLKLGYSEEQLKKSRGR